MNAYVEIVFDNSDHRLPVRFAFMFINADCTARRRVAKKLSCVERLA
jgi:chromosome segregation ATPase